MKVLLTGAAGGVGKIAAKGLHDMGAEVIGFSRTPVEVEGVSDFRAGNVTDYETLKKVMQDCDEVVHLAAVHMPFDAPEQELFQINVGGTFNIFKACSELGIKRVTVASSPNAIGYNFGVKIKDLSYVPVDEQHPLFTTDPYSFSKQAIEEIGRYFYRRLGISSVFMRLGLDFRMTVEEWLEAKKSDMVTLRAMVDGLLALPEKEAAQEVRRIENALNEKRYQAIGVPHKNGTEYVYAKYTEEERIWNYYIHNYLMFLDKRDLADSIVKSVNTEFVGSHDIFVADHSNMLGIPSAKLAALVYPGARLKYEQLKGYDAMVDYRSAKELIGFYAQHSVASYYDVLYKKQD